MQSKGFLKTFSKLFPLPKEMSFDFVGVDVTKKFVRVVKFEDKKIGKIPVLFKEYSLSENCGLMNSDPKQEDCAEFVEVLKNVKRDFKVKYVNVSIPEIRTYIYKTKLPVSVKDEIQNTLLFSIEENAPMKPEDALLDYFVVDIDDSEISVIVTAVSKEIINLYAEVFEEADLIPISFEPETHAISRSIIKKGDNGSSLLLNLDSANLNIAVIEDEIVQYTQTLPIIRIDEQNHLSKDELKTLKEEIQKVIIYWETSINNRGENKINTLYLVGSLAPSSNVLNYLDKNLPVNVKFANVWNNCFSLDDYIPSIKSQDSLKYACAIGLSLKKIK